MFSETLQEVVLSRGLIDATGQRHRSAWLRPLTGAQEAALSGSQRLDPHGVSELLSDSVARLGGYADPEPALMGALTRSDRSRLVLWLRASLFGDRVLLTITCPNPACGELADMDLRISEIAPPPTALAPEAIEVATPAGAAVLREPTGEDDQHLAGLEGSHRSRAGALWQRLVTLEGEPLSDWWALDAASRHQLALALHRMSQAPELSFVTRCPSCAGWIELHLDPVRLLRRQLALGAGRLLVEVHALAFHYGWGEAEILALSRTRRWRYLELLRRQVEGRPLLETWS